MPILQKEIELNDGSKILVRQVSGMERLEIDSKQAKVFRGMRDFGPNPMDWTSEQQLEFADALDEAGCGPTAQMAAWIPNCIVTEGFDANDLTMAELQDILRFVRGDEEPEGAVPLSSS
tara:strand:- start:9136 stop:9492 length:357 start_codon:yes stop_codon:yes gene_type:complete